MAFDNSDYITCNLMDTPPVLSYLDAFFSGRPSANKYGFPKTYGNSMGIGWHEACVFALLGTRLSKQMIVTTEKY